ncbi:MAG: TAXI family TRAP transporter solute-binding subunit [Clostridia bacterium]|nr:TAXI family TRAP transporter solute-binding subunit [Clostridia bacterium]
MKTLKTILSLMMVALMLVSIVACNANPAEQSSDDPAGDTEKETLVIITGTQGGAYYIMASAVANLLEQYSTKYTASVVSSSAVTVESILKLQSHEAAIGFAVSGQVYGAYTGNPDETTAQMVTEQCDDLRLLAGSHSGEIHLIVKANSGIETIADLEGKSISISNTGTGANIEMCRMLRVAGLEGKYKGVNSSMQESIDALKDSAVDVAQVTSGWPAPVVQDAFASIDVDFFHMPEEIIDATIAEAPYLMKTVIPAGTYPNQDEDYITLSIPNAIYIHAGLSDEVVTELCEIIFGHHDELVTTYAVFSSYTPENTIAASAAIPLHPAVEAYFKAQGWM